MYKFFNYFVGLILGVLRATLSLVFCIVFGVFIFIYTLYEAVSGKKDPWRPIDTAKEILESQREQEAPANPPASEQDPNESK